MEFKTDTIPALEQIPFPAFVVREGKIVGANIGAQNRQFLVGINISEMLETGKEEYESLNDGQLSLVLCCNDISYDTTVIRQGQETLFLMNSEYAQPELKALSLAAQHLREPLSNAMNDADQLLPKLAAHTDADLHQQLLQINRSLYRLQRAIGNMADAAKFHRTAAALELRDAVEILAEILEKASVLLERSKKRLEYTLPNESVYTLVNTEILERGLLNLISNAAKQSDESTIRVSVTKTIRSICVTVQNNCSSTAVGNLFDRYLRQPDIEDGRNGIGLGLSIVRSCAYTHRGTVLTEYSQPGSFKITMSLRIQQACDNMLRMPVQLPFDYAGGRDHALIELSDVLSSDAYDQK